MSAMRLLYATQPDGTINVHDSKGRLLGTVKPNHMTGFVERYSVEAFGFVSQITNKDQIFQAMKTAYHRRKEANDKRTH